MTALAFFSFEGTSVRVIERGAEPWFVVKDVCQVLAISNSRDTVNTLDSDEKATVANPDSRPGKPGAKSFQIVSESGLYALIFKSRKPEAKAFRKWVTAVVLPAIRKTGTYQADPVVDLEREALLARLDETERKLSYVIMQGAAGNMSTTLVKAIAAAAGRQLESIRLRLELRAGMPPLADVGATTQNLEGGAA